MNQTRLVTIAAAHIAAFSPLAIAESLDDQLDTALAFAEVQAERLAHLTGPERYPCYTDTSGVWIGRDLNGWCCGFTAGLMWMLYDHTGDTKWANYGREWNDAIRPRATASDNDTGFQVFNAFGYALRHAPDALTEEETRDYEGVIRWATETFTTQRYNAHVGGFRTWPPTLYKPYEGEFEINSDMVMNLEMPVYVAQATGDMELIDKISRHADTTWQHTVFKDGDSQWESPGSDEYVPRRHGSHWHVVGFDPQTGTVINKRTEQGDKAESTWSRGQAWLVYGYTMLYRYTGYERMLERAEVVFDYYVSAVAAQSDDSIPYTDFDAPVDDSHGRDTAAAAIVASAAIELYEITKDARYLEAAEAILSDLTAPPYLATGTSYHSVLTGGSWMYDKHEEVGTVFGDFYLVEAILRYKQLKSGQ